MAMAGGMWALLTVFYIEDKILKIIINILSGQDKNPALLQAYSLLRNVAESKPAVDTPESFSPDLYVLCAEIAFQVSVHVFA